MLRHLMLDLETWGTCPGCAVRSIGAITFDPETAELGDEFYVAIDDKSSKKLKLKWEDGTVKFWAKPEMAHANAQIENDPKKVAIVDGVTLLTQFVRKVRTQFVWSQGSNFDGPIIEHVYRVLGLEPPWKFWDTRDTRTAYDMAKFNFKGQPRAGTYHNALEDARHQAVCVSRAYAKAQGRIL